MKKKVISACLGFEHCRYDGRLSGARGIKKRAGGVKFYPICPEVAIGLGVPRARIRLVKTAQGIRLIQPSTGKDLTAKMRRFGKSFLKKAGRVDGFILKSKSPSCGIGNVKIYSGPKSRKPVARGTGIFAALILKTKGVQHVQCI